MAGIAQPYTGWWNQYPYNTQPYYAAPMNPQPAYQPPQPQQSGDGIKFVDGIKKAEEYPVAPGNAVVLMDKNEPVFYIKDASGVKIYDYTERQAPKQPEYVTKEEFDELKKLLEDLTK